MYIPEQSVLPDELIGELGLTGRLAGGAANRVKAVRLRGELSQGLVCRPKALAGVDLTRAAAEGTDFAERLGITKWVPPIPTTMDGEVEPAPDLLPWVDITTRPQAKSAGAAPRKGAGNCASGHHAPAGETVQGGSAP